MKKIAEGKTKEIFEMPSNPERVFVHSKNDITAGNGKRHEIMVGKAELATQTTTNVFELLNRKGVPTSFCYKATPTTFVAEKCTMLPYEVVVRCEAHGSYLKRYPKMKKGDKLHELVAELFLKTAGKKWKDFELACDDPLMIITAGKIDLYLPDVPVEEQTPFLTLAFGDVFTQPNELDLICSMVSLACTTFSLLKDAWAELKRNLVDYKVEFGINSRGELRLADVIDNDSWRLVYRDEYEDKQGFREGEEIAAAFIKYKRVAELTQQFAMAA
jgi:phosphoribosylaminoimidazole carboxylase/phosphoribosylaminoimidazole-succinocarboxamide synthase